MPVSDAAFDAKVRVPLRGAAVFSDGLKVVLNGFSHKRPRVGGPTSASALMTLISARGEEPFRLSIDGTEGKPGLEYERRFFREYEFALVGWGYDAFVEIVVTRFNTVAASYGAALDLRAGGPMALFDDAFKIRLAQTGSETSADGRATARYALVEVLMDDSGGREHSRKIYENGTIALQGRWIGEPGMLVSGRIIQLVKLKDDGAELRVERR